MFVVRPAAASDLDVLAALAEIASPGVHTRPRSRAAVARALERSIASFAAVPDVPGDESYLFVLEAADGAIAGTAALAATAGAAGTYFAFRIDVQHQVSRDLGISHNVQALTLSSDLTACSQLSGFFLRAALPPSEAALLARARLLFAALAPQRFADRFFAAMAGTTDADGRSPFWEALGRKFFRMDFLQAEHMVEGARNSTVIVELMPHYPVYVPLLPPQAQAAMGQVHDAARQSFALLKTEGFGAGQYVDIFDGGPILQAPRSALRSFSQATLRTVAGGPVPSEAPGARYLVAAARDDRFRAVVADGRLPDLSEDVWLEEAARRALEVSAGDTVLCVRV